MCRCAGPALAAAGLLQLAGWAMFYQALRAGPVGLVSAVAASDGAITVLLAVTVTAERLAVPAAAGIVQAPAGRARALRRCPAAARWLAVCAGLVEAAALLALARGGQDGQIAVTAAVSNLYPVVPLAPGVLWFRERLTARQVLGAGIITAGLVLLSIA